MAPKNGRYNRAVTTLHSERSAKPGTVLDSWPCHPTLCINSVLPTIQAFSKTCQERHNEKARAVKLFGYRGRHMEIETGGPRMMSDLSPAQDGKSTPIRSVSSSILEHADEIEARDLRQYLQRRQVPSVTYRIVRAGGVPYHELVSFRSPRNLLSFSHPNVSLRWANVVTLVLVSYDKEG